MIDANINRLREGLRVVEDVLRYGYNDTVFIPRIKQLRHLVARIDDATLGKRIFWRDSQNDTGFSNTGINENNRTGLQDLLRANILRCQEAARVLEESLKIPDCEDDLYRIAKSMRYDIYTLEKEIYSHSVLNRKNVDLSLYLVACKLENEKDFLQIIEEALSGGVTAVQYRDKELSDKDFLSNAAAIKKICHRMGVPFIINDRVDVCLALDADGVHLGQDDMPLECARKILGQNKIIGISANNLEDVLKANESPADYIGFGALFSTPVKSTYKEYGIMSIPEVLKMSRLPVVFIGGITLENIHQVREAGAKNIAVVRAVMDAEDPKDAAKRLLIS